METLIIKTEIDEMPIKYFFKVTPKENRSTTK